MAKKYNDQLLILDDAREVFSMALISLGFSANDNDIEHINMAYKRLKELMPNIRLFTAQAEKPIYIDEDITVGMGWNGAINIASKENHALDYILPAEGYVISLDSIAIPINAPHIENVYKFINFILRAEIAKQISMETGYATANLAAVKLLPKEIRENQITYPDQKTIARGQFQTDAGNASAIIERYYQQLKLGG